MFGMEWNGCAGNVWNVWRTWRIFIVFNEGSEGEQSESIFEGGFHLEICMDIKNGKRQI
jgi:hypothetical protein